MTQANVDAWVMFDGVTGASRPARTVLRRMIQRIHSDLIWRLRAADI